MSNLQQLKSQYETVKSDYLSRKGRRDQLVEDKDKIKTQIEEVEESTLLKEKTATFLRMVGDYARQQAKENLEIMVTNALRYVFKEQVDFKIRFEQKRGRPEAEFYIVSYYENETIETTVEDQRGGGLVDVVSITLRIALAESFGIEGPIIMDEPAKHLSAEYIPAFAEFLKQTSEQFDRQIIMVTHNTALTECGDITYHVQKKNGVSEVNIIRENEEE